MASCLWVKVKLWNRLAGEVGAVVGAAAPRGAPETALFLLLLLRPSLQSVLLARLHVLLARRKRLGVDVKVILTQLCIFFMGNHEWNIQGGVRMTLTSTATSAAESLLPLASTITSSKSGSLATCRSPKSTLHIVFLRFLYEPPEPSRIQQTLWGFSQKTGRDRSSTF